MAPWIYIWASMGYSPEDPKLEGPPSSKNIIDTGGVYT